MTKLYVCEISNLIEELKSDENAMEVYFEKLGELRIEHILKHNRAEDRARALGASLLLLFALWQEGYELPSLPDFAYEKKGKPYLMGLEQVHFNLSHTKNIVTCVISNKEVGVDVEHVRQIKENTTNRVFTEKEKQMAMYSEEGYVRIWTMKEACAKLIGTGISEIIDGLEIVKNSSGITVKKLNQNIIKTFCYKIIAEGKLSDNLEYPYYYSICANESDHVECIYTKWDSSRIMYC